MFNNNKNYKFNANKHKNKIKIKFKKKIFKNHLLLKKNNQPIPTKHLTCGQLNLNWLVN